VTRDAAAILAGSRTNEISSRDHRSIDRRCVPRPWVRQTKVRLWKLLHGDKLSGAVARRHRQRWLFADGRLCTRPPIAVFR